MDPTCDIPRVAPSSFPDPLVDIPSGGSAGPRTAVLAGGCFWCVEAVYKEIDGVLEVTSGYAGGTAETADYRTVCSGRTDHAEAVLILFDPARVSYGQLLKVFFSIAHDPTQLDRQGADQGRQYRSAIFPLDEEQKKVAEAYIRQLDEARVLDKPIRTRIEPPAPFYAAESYHQDYAARNPTQPYVVYTSVPKVDKLRQQYPERLKARASR